MSDKPENLTLIFLRRLDGKMDRVLEEVIDLRGRMNTLESQVGNLVATEQSHYAQVMLRMDRHDARLDRIERRLDLVDSPGTS